MSRRAFLAGSGGLAVGAGAFGVGFGVAASGEEAATAPLVRSAALTRPASRCTMPSQGLPASRGPRELVEMPFIANDRLDPECTHADLLLTSHPAGRAGGPDRPPQVERRPARGHARDRRARLRRRPRGPRRANPRTPETAANLILRRGYSYARGFDAAGQLDQGLAFACFQRSLADGFLAVQARLTGEGLVA